MSDKENEVIANDWKAFRDTKGFAWLVYELEDVIALTIRQELDANPLDFCFRPWKYVTLKAKRKGAEDLRDQILRILE